MARNAEDIFKKAASLIAETNKERGEKAKLLEEDRKAMIEQLGAHMERVLSPVLSSVVENANASRQDLQKALSELQIQAPVIPEIKLPPINVPQPKVTVNVPEVKVPQAPAVNVPPVNFPDRMTVNVDGVDPEAPLAVRLYDGKGKPFQFSSVGGGGKADFFTIKDIRGSTASLINQIDGALKVTGSFAASLSLDYGSGEIGSATARFVQATDAISSVNVVGTSVVQPVSQVSGAVWSVQAYNIFSTLTTSSVVNPDNRVKVELPATSVTVSSITSSASSVRTRQTNPTAIASDNVPPGADDLGRTLTRPIQVRDLTRTAYVTLTDSSEDTLLAATSGAYLDLIEVMCANASDAAQTIHLRASSGGNIVSTIVIPAESTAGIANTVPLPQGNIGNAWTAQNAGSGLSNTTVYITAKFSQEV